MSLYGPQCRIQDLLQGGGREVDPPAVNCGNILELRLELLLRGFEGVDNDLLLGVASCESHTVVARDTSIMDPGDPEDPVDIGVAGLGEEFIGGGTKGVGAKAS